MLTQIEDCLPEIGIEFEVGTIWSQTYGVFVKVVRGILEIQVPNQLDQQFCQVVREPLPSQR